MVELVRRTRQGGHQVQFFPDFFLEVKAPLKARSINLPNFGRWKLASTLAAVGSVSLVVVVGGALEHPGSSLLQRTFSLQCNVVEGLSGGTFGGFYSLNDSACLLCKVY